MNRINRKVEYALMALKYLSELPPSTLVSVKAVCENTGSPFDATARVMQIMSHHHVLKSEQGAQGGYRLIADLGKISFYDLNAMILGPMGVVRCLHAEFCDLSDRCNIQTPLQILNERLEGLYRNLTLSELLELDRNPVLCPNEPSRSNRPNLDIHQEVSQ